MIDLSADALILLVFAFLLLVTDGFGGTPAESCENLCSFASGTAAGILLLNILYLSGIFGK